MDHLEREDNMDFEMYLKAEAVNLLWVILSFRVSTSTSVFTVHFCYMLTDEEGAGTVEIK